MQFFIACWVTSSGTAAAVVGDSKVVIFGGSRGRKWLNEVVVLDTGIEPCTRQFLRGSLRAHFMLLLSDSWRWSRPRVKGSAPEPRSYHTLTAVGDKVVRVLSFVRSNVSLWFWQDQHVLFPFRFCSVEMIVIRASGKFTFSTRQTLVRAIARGFHASLPSRYFSLFLVCRALPRPQGSWHWEQPQVLGRGPSPRTGHTATHLGNGMVVIVGGWDPNADVRFHARRLWVVSCFHRVSVDVWPMHACVRVRVCTACVCAGRL